MAGLSVLLEGRKEVSRAPQIISKSFVLRPFSPRPSPPTSGFLEACFLCGKQLSLEKDIYMYRGDKAFCSVECRCRQIFMDEEETVRRENCSLAASPYVRARESRGAAGPPPPPADSSTDGAGRSRARGRDARADFLLDPSFRSFWLPERSERPDGVAPPSPPPPALPPLPIREE